ncbi:MAG: uncharacterized protein QOH58_3288 [Thermoleophilaceae bacterium]|jgi:uncharacterized protein Yka (UPF0111/DUF47 family)|nr:uncharacterized protein [Thermoleophilaceae bacterium]
MVAGMASSIAKLVGRAPDYAELNRMLARAGRNVERATALLRELMRAWPDGAEKRHARPAVPFERSDVLALASGLDDVVDYAEEAADFLGLYRVDAPMDQAIALADTLAAAGHEVSIALGSLADLGGATPHLLEIKRLENDGDRLLREGLTALFEGGVDPMVVIRWKDIFERVEEGIDACDRVAHVLRGIAVKRT